MAKVPTEYLLAPSPIWSTTKGKYVTDKDSIKEIIKRFRKDGVSLPIFFDHPPDDVRNKEPAAGFFDIEARDDGIWAVNIQWSEVARQQIAQGGWAFHSPEFAYEKVKGADGRVLQIFADALVHEPATQNQVPITAARDLPEGVAICRASAVAFPSEQSDSAREGESINLPDTENEMAEETKEALAVLKADGAKKDEQIARLTKDLDGAKNAAAEADKLIASVMEVAECDQRDALVGIIKAHKDGAAETRELAEKVKKFQADAEEAEKAAFIQSAKVGEDKIKWLESQPLPVVKSYVETCCKVPEVPSTPQSAEATPDDGGTPEPWFVEVHSDLDEEKLRAEWKAHRAWAKKNPHRSDPKFNEPDAD